MKRKVRWAVVPLAVAGVGTLLFLHTEGAQAARAGDAGSIVTGEKAFTSYQTESPGTRRKITVADLPQPYATEGFSNNPSVVARPANAWPKSMPGFTVQLAAQDLDEPREIRTAPNGDFFVSESTKGQVEVFRGIGKDGKLGQKSLFAKGLVNNFGIAFYPAKDPQWVYVGNTNSVVRFPYKRGDTVASGPSQTIVPELPKGGGHITRDLAFSPDGTRLFVSVGSASNVDDPDTHHAEFHRANILEFTPEGKFTRIYASGIRNPVGIAIDPATGKLWCSTNERDMLGNNLVPDYITSVQEGGFYGWPWYYMGNHHDPRLPGKHPELGSKVIVPDVLLQPHNASLQLTFYEGSQFPGEYKGNIFAAEHGSWNRKPRAGYEVIRVPVVDGKATGDYQDFLTGFVTPDDKVWGRPVGVTVAPDGSLLVTDDGSNSIWRVVYKGA